MIVKVQAQLPPFNLMSDEEAGKKVGKTIKFLGCPARISSCRTIRNGTGIWFSIEVSQAFNSYLEMRMRYFNNLEDDDSTPIDFLEEEE